MQNKFNMSPEKKTTAQQTTITGALHSAPQLPISTKPKPITTKHTTKKPTTKHTTKPTTKHTTKPTTKHTTQKPTTQHTTQKPTTQHTTKKPTTQHTTKRPTTQHTTKSTTQRPTTPPPTGTGSGSTGEISGLSRWYNVPSGYQKAPEIKPLRPMVPQTATILPSFVADNYGAMGIVAIVGMVSNVTTAAITAITAMATK